MVRNLTPADPALLTDSVQNSYVAEIARPLKKVTCVKSLLSDRTHYIAVAEIYLQEPDKLYVSLYNQLKPKANSPNYCLEIKLPRVEAEPVEEPADDKKHSCHYHGKV